MQRQLLPVFVLTMAPSGSQHPRVAGKLQAPLPRVHTTAGTQGLPHPSTGSLPFPMLQVLRGGQAYLSPLTTLLPIPLSTLFLFSHHPIGSGVIFAMSSKQNPGLYLARLSKPQLNAYMMA